MVVKVARLYDPQRAIGEASLTGIPGSIFAERLPNKIICNIIPEATATVWIRIREYLSV